MTDLRFILLRLDRHLTVAQVVERVEADGVKVTEDCLSRIRRGVTKNPRYLLGKAIERIAAEFGESV